MDLSDLRLMEGQGIEDNALVSFSPKLAGLGQALLSFFYRFKWCKLRTNILSKKIRKYYLLWFLFTLCFGTLEMIYSNIPSLFFSTFVYYIIRYNVHRPFGVQMHNFSVKCRFKATKK